MNNPIAVVDPLANGETCSWCDSLLYGSLVINSMLVETVAGEIEGISITENSPRNWIICDSCNVIVCHTCAPRFSTGYCEDCIRDYELEFDEDGGIL